MLGKADLYRVFIGASLALSWWSLIVLAVLSRFGRVDGRVYWVARRNISKMPRK
jgi:hypothetical protein